MTGKQNGKLLKSKLRSNRSSAESPQKDDLMNNSPDLSVLRKPIHTSVTGFLQARDVFDTGTEEIKQLLSTECDVIYECRVCRNLFRSLANFISHKRIYCRQKFNTSLHAHFINTKYLKDDMVSILQNEQDYQNFLNNKTCTPGILQADKESRQRNFTKDLTTVIERLTSKHDNENSRITKNAALRLQPISQTTEAVYQSIFDSTLSQESIKKQVNEIHSLESSQDVTLGPDGKIIDDTPNANDKEVIHISDDEEDDRSSSEPTHNSNIICKICRQKFSTQKTLRFHIKYKHAENRLVYPCPDCSETFANAWGVYRHLLKIHRKSATYIRKLRESIHNKAFRLQRKTKLEAQVNADKEMEMSEQHRLDLENQEWMDNLEGDCEVPRCGGCGRKFERRAALSAHRQTCQLRIAAQNKITTNMQKRQAAKTTKEMPASQSKGDSEKSDVSAAKISRLETKPIEIQIRRDYHKNSISSPKRTGTPLSEANGSVCAEEDGKKKGEEGDSSVINSFPCNIIDRHYSKETVQDKDDASIVNNSASNRNVDLGLQDSDGNNTDLDEDDELNFEDIRRICQVADTAQPSLANKDKTQDKSLHTAMEVDSEAILDEDCVMVSSQDSSSIKMECEASFTCNKCSEELISLDKLNEHIKNKHEVTLYQCKFCNYKAEQMSDCISHVRNKHKMLGDDLRIGKFVKSVSVPVPGCQQLDSSEDEEEVSLTSTACQTVGDDDFATVEQIYKKGDNLPAASTDSSPIKEEVLSNSSSANCSDMEGEMSAAKRKRGRPRKYEEQLPVRGNKVTSVKIVKKVTNLESPIASANKVLNVSAEEIITSCSSNKDKNKQGNKPAPKSDPKTYMDNKSDKKVSDTQDTASSMSSTVKRPMRNRVKPLNKDFEYDLSNLLKLEAEAYKESHLPTVIYKQPLKRKPLLQNEITTSDPSTQVGEVKERHKSEAEKTCAGALHAVSMRAAEKMKAHMKQMPAIVQKELPAFIAQRRSRVTPVTSPKVLSLPSTPKKDVPVPLKTKTEKSPVQQQITPSMIYEKLSLDNSNSRVDATSLNKTPPGKVSRSASNIDIKNEILTNMSKILSKTSKRHVQSIDMSCKIGVVGIDKNRDQSIRFISVKKEKDLLSPTRLTKKSALSSSEAEEKASPQNPESVNPENDQTKPDQKNLEDETSEFVASEKLNSVNILRKKKPILHVKCDKIFVEPSAKQKSLILTLKDKFYKQGLSKNDAVDQVGVSENVQSNHSPVSAEIDKKKSMETSICDSVTSNETSKLVNSVVGESGSGTIDEGFEETLGEKLPGEKSVESSG